MRQLWLIPSILLLVLSIDTIYHLARDYYRKLSGTLALTEDEKQTISSLDGEKTESPERFYEKYVSRSSSYAGSISVTLTLVFLVFANLTLTWRVLIYTILFASIARPIVLPLFQMMSTRLGWVCFKLSHRKQGTE